MKRAPGVCIGTFFLAVLGAAACADRDMRPEPSADRDHGSSRTAEDARRPADHAMSLPVYRVVGRGADIERAARLAGALGIDESALVKGAVFREDGVVRYLDHARFQRVPTRKAAPPAPGFRDERGFETTEGDDAMDFDALERMRVLSGQDAAERAMEALGAAELEVGGVMATSHSILQALDAQGGEVMRAELDTGVSFRDELEGLRLIGPGAKVRVTFDPDGVVSHLIYARREIERGEDVAVVPPSEAGALCASALGGGEGLSVEAELVYYAPPLSRDIKRIVPHYVCSGKRASGGYVVDVRRSIIPAIEDAPRASLAVEVNGATVSAEASVVGGTAPYTYTWVSSTRSLDRTLVDATRMEYTIEDPMPRSTAETLSLQVTDADGLVATAARTVEVTPAPGGRRRAPSARDGQQGTFGTEWVGTCGGLDKAAANVDGLVGEFRSAGMDAKFNWGDNRAWEIDFKDSAAGGQDVSFADSVDFTFYTGHANNVGFLFCSNVSDGFLHFSDAHWGDTNLEWLLIAACGPLQDDAGAWRARWSGAFDGLHLLLGYATESYDDTNEGATFARYLLDGASPAPLRQAWVTTAIEIQPDDEVIYGVMGVYGADWTMPNYDDHFWGKGPVGPDLRGAAKMGYWRVSGTT
jgi:hypothetical protein